MKQQIKEYFLDYLFYVLLLPYSSNNLNKQAVNTTPSNASSLNNSAQLNEIPNQTDTTLLTSNTPPNTEIPACLSENIYKRLKNDLNLDNFFHIIFLIMRKYFFTLLLVHRIQDIVLYK